MEQQQQQQQASIPHENDQLDTDINKSMLDFTVYINKGMSSSGTSTDQSTTSQVNKRIEQITSNAHLQRQRWNAFFDPQYTFESFVHGVTQPLDNKDEHKRNIDRLIDEGNRIRSPKSVETTMIHHENGHLSSGLMTPKSPLILRDLNQQGRKGQLDEEMLKKRLELLRQIRTEPEVDTVENETNEFNKVENEDSIPCYKLTFNWKTRLVRKAKQLRKQVQHTTGSPISSRSSTLDSNDIENKKREIIQDKEEVSTTKNKGLFNFRPSFLCFLFGFIFPPLWLLGASYPFTNQQMTSASKRIDLTWKRRSRIAFCIFAICSSTVLVVMFLLNPKSIGWRFSKTQQEN